MLDVCRHRAETEGLTSRCCFHEWYLDSLPTGYEHDAATCFLVSQFVLEQDPRSAFFRAIADRFEPGGIQARSDLASGMDSHTCESLLIARLNMMATADVPPEGLERMRRAYASDVVILPTESVTFVIESGGCEPPVQFFQAGQIHGRCSKRRARGATEH